MTGKHSGVITCGQAVGPDATWVHCSIHQENALQLERRFGHYSENGNFVKARPLNSIFSALCNDMGSDHVMLLQHTEVHLLSRGKVLMFF